MRTYPLDSIRTNARNLRKTMSDAEQMLWKQLRREQLGVKFRKQYPIAHYITDFACLELKLIIELDGGQHSEEAAIHYDLERTALIESRGFTVLRFWNHDVLGNLEGCLIMIQDMIRRSQSSPPPNLPPAGGGTL